MLVVQSAFHPLVLPNGDEFHLGCDDSAAGVVHLGDIASRPGAHGAAEVLESKGVQAMVGQSQLAIPGGDLREVLNVIAVPDPLAPDGVQPLADVDRDRRVGVGAAGVIEGDRWVENRVLFGAAQLSSGCLGHLAQGDSNGRMNVAGRVDLLRSRKGIAGDGAQLALINPCLLGFHQQTP